MAQKQEAEEARKSVLSPNKSFKSSTPIKANQEKDNNELWNSMQGAFPVYNDTQTPHYNKSIRPLSFYKLLPQILVNCPPSFINLFEYLQDSKLNIDEKTRKNLITAFLTVDLTVNYDKPDKLEQKFIQKAYEILTLVAGPIPSDETDQLIKGLEAKLSESLKPRQSEPLFLPTYCTQGRAVLDFDISVSHTKGEIRKLRISQQDIQNWVRPVMELANQSMFKFDIK